MTHARGWVALAALLSVSLLAPSAGAQASAAAETLFNQGRDAIDAGDYDTACARFRESDRLDPAVGTKLNLAACEEKRGKLATAWELFRACVEQLPPSDDRHPIARARVTALEPRIPRVTLRVSAKAPSGTTVRSGETELGAAAYGLALPFDPGRHELLVSAPGHEPRTYRLELAEGARQEIELEPGAPVRSASESQAPPPPAASSGGSSNVLGYVLGGIGVAGLATGAVTGVVLLGKKSTADEECDTERQVCSPEGKQANDSGRDLAPISTIAWIVGFAGVGAGAYFLLSSSPDTETALSTQLSPQQARVTLLRRF